MAYKQELWDEAKKKCRIGDEKYTGTMVQLKTKLDSVGGKQVSRPKEEYLLLRLLWQGVVQCPLRHHLLQTAVIQDRFRLQGH